MLRDLNGNTIRKPWHDAKYLAWRQRLTQQQIVDIEREIDARIASKNTVSVPSVFEEIWTPTPFERIYDTAARCDWNQARLCAGLFLCDRIIRDSAIWHFFPQETAEDHTRMIYFRVAQTLLNVETGLSGPSPCGRLPPV